MAREMSERSFDDLARGLAEGSISRRRALKLFAGTAVAALIPSTRAMAAITCPPGTVKICHVPRRADGTCRRGEAETRCVTPEQAAAKHASHPCDCCGGCGGTNIVASRGLGRASRRRLCAYRMAKPAAPTVIAVAASASVTYVYLQTPYAAAVRAAACLPRV